MEDGYVAIVALKGRDRGLVGSGNRIESFTAFHGVAEHGGLSGSVSVDCLYGFVRRSLPFGCLGGFAPMGGRFRGGFWVSAWAEPTGERRDLPFPEGITPEAARHRAD